MAYQLSTQVYIPAGLAWSAFRAVAEGADQVPPDWTQLGDNPNNWVSSDAEGLLLLWDTNGTLTQATPTPSVGAETAALSALNDAGLDEDYPGTVRGYYARNGEALDGEAIVLLQNVNVWRIIVLRTAFDDPQIGASEQNVLGVFSTAVIFSIPTGEVYFDRQNGGPHNRVGRFLMGYGPNSVVLDGQGQPIQKPVRDPNETAETFRQRLYDYQDSVAAAQSAAGSQAFR